MNELEVHAGVVLAVAFVFVPGAWLRLCHVDCLRGIDR